MNPLIYVFASILFVTVSQLLFKQGVTVLQQRTKAEGTPAWKHYLSMVFQPHIFIGLFCNGMAAIFWLLSLSRFELSYVFPFISMNYILVPLAAMWIFKERMSTARLAGIGIIFVGIFLIAFS